VLARLVLCTLVVILLGAARAEAQTFTVSNSNDSGAGSLRDAVVAAGDGDSVVIPASVTAPIVLTGGQIVIDKSITITGAGASVTVVDGNHASRAFDIASDGASHPEVTISDLTVTHGNQTGVPGGGAVLIEPFNTLHLARAVLTANDTLPNGDAGGAVFDQGGTLTIDRSTISDNQSPGDGGGVFIESFMGGAGVATISDSTISGNSNPFGRFGGGVANFHGTLTIQRSTISGNSAGRAGGGVSSEGSGDGATTLVDSTVAGNDAPTPGFEGGGVYIGVSGAPVLLLNDTIAGNTGSSGTAMQPGSPGGLVTSDGVTQIFNTIVAGNSGVAGHENCNSPSFVAEDHNLEDMDTCGFHATGDITGVDPLLTTLEDNGGPTFTRQPIPNSPAIGAADATKCPAVDQRGVPYFAPNPCDIGAVDTQRPAPPGSGPGGIATGGATAIARLGIHPASFAAAGRGGSVAAKGRRHTGTTISYIQLAAGRTSFVVRAARHGVRSRSGKCVKRTKRNAHGHRCTRFVKVGGFSRAARAGANRFHFTGRVRHHKLRPGSYRLDATAGTGAAKRTVRRAFRIVP
jgi:hypothetical protein